MVEDCNVCLDKSGLITCNDCGWISCRSCIEKYFLISTRPYNHCMKCGKRWILQDYHLTTEFKEGALCQWRRELFYRRELRFIRQQFKETITSNHFRHACPMEDCVGYINDQDTCVACDRLICSHCHVVAHEGECKEEDKKNWGVILKNTRPCPQCAVPIQKASGCYQMWCVHCHFSFDFTTGKELSRKSFHNPHFLEYLQVREKHHHNTLPDVQQYIESCGSMTKKEKYQWIRFMRLLQAIRRQCDFSWFCDPLSERDDGLHTLDARKQYVLGIIGMDEFKDRIYDRMMSLSKKWELSCFWNRVVTRGTSLLHNLLKSTIDHKKCLDKHMRDTEYVLLENEIGCFLDFSIVLF